MVSLWIVLVSFFSFILPSDSIRNDIDDCCTQGKKWGRLGSFECSDISGPTEFCTYTMQICCKSSKEATNCKAGVVSAQTSSECPESNFEIRKCCEGCKLGLLIKKLAGGSCGQFQGSLGEPWKKSFVHCCSNDESLTGPKLPRPNICPPGFKHNQRLNLCDDVDECSENVHNCSDTKELCENTVGSFKCTDKSSKNCPDGYTFYLVSCIDINECTKNIHTCSSDEFCVNKAGGYECKKTELNLDTSNPSCRPGFQFDSSSNACLDINECQAGLHSCLDTQRCDNTIGSFTCVRFMTCGTGYTLNQNTGECEDNDECAMGMDNCSSLGGAYTCRNIQGSFRCEKRKCDIGEILNEAGFCAPLICRIGFEPGSSGTCKDIDECQDSPCDLRQECKNTIGSFECIEQCDQGLRLNSQTSKCEDIDECLLGIATCTGINRICVNTIGNFECQCSSGFEENDSGTCQDVNECSDPNICGIDSECQNYIGSFRCLCKTGFSLVEGLCQDVDECVTIPEICQQSCTNLWGTYKCSCRAGYRLSSDSRSCMDIDECHDYENLCLGNCINSPGSFQCTCPSGYTLSSNNRSCIDLDECAQRDNVCDVSHNKHCFNTRGSYQCVDISCPDGYTYEKGITNHKCRRISLRCKLQDLPCRRKPVTISHNFISLKSNIKIPDFGVNLFEMQSAKLQSLTTKFTLNVKEVGAPADFKRKVNQSYFTVKKKPYQAIITLLKSVQGPQNILLELSMDMYQGGRFQASAKALIHIYVSPHDF